MARKLKDTYHKIGELLVRRKLAPTEAVDDALAEQRSEIQQHHAVSRLGDILVRRKLLTRKVIEEILEEQRIGRGEKNVLRVDLRDADGVAIVVLEGRVEERTAETATKVLERLMNRGFSKVALDGRKLIFLNSHGISCFVAYIDEARARGGDLKFFGLNEDVRLVLERLGLSKFVQVFSGEEEAIRAFNLSIDEYMSRGALAEYISASGNRSYHLSYCSQAQKINEDDRQYFESKWHARDAKKTPCKACRP